MFEKFIIAEKSEVIDTETEKTVIGWGSKPLPDRDGELIEASAWDLENFRKNPVLCLSHDLTKPPVGKVIWVKNDPNGLKFKAQFANTERGRELYQLYKEGMMTAFSVGFRPKKDGFVDFPMDEKYKGLKRVFKSVELFEVSCVTVPSLPSAVVEYVKSGQIKSHELKEELEDIITKAVEAGTLTKDVKEKEIPKVEENAPADDIKTSTTVEEDDVKALKDQIAEMKSKLDEVTKKLEIEEETKTLDNITRQPSVYDIMSALSRFFEKGSSTNNGLPEVVASDRPSSIYVIDIYPTEYPNGICVFRVFGNPSKTYRQGYVYDGVTKIASLTDQPIQVEEAWVGKKYNPDQLFGKDMVEVKDEEISFSIRTKMEECMDRIISEVDNFHELLNNKDVEEEEDIDEEDDTDTENEVEEENDDEIDLEDDSDTHVDDDEIQIDDEVEDKNDEEVEIDEKDLSEIVTKALGNSIELLKSTVTDKAKEEVSKLMGKATI